MANKDQTINEVVITRIFDAPRELVFKAWTDPEHLIRWWGPKNFTSPACRLDLRVGGKYVFGMRSPEGQEFWSTGIFREIVIPEKLVYTDSFADEKGNQVPASHYGFTGEFPEETTVSLTFETVGDKTKLTLRHIGLPKGEISEMTKASWNEMVDKLDESLQ
ncbi:SRPBCC domain-containing protein [Leptospira sp. 201903070]|uniref:SRPBCC domain-containing protein n=1 Tax=Leptospira ainlahdjerensis TaxID=2810033 RepID=A0ABS2U6U7_9LEPT|nr:SRPBCC domain-containing protein [Leptospira ainlahdjerensis]MBM9575859.1 SRPBCC domain-containing protein [Leptospira ainlahdjerensis]